MVDGWHRPWGSIPWGKWLGLAAFYLMFGLAYRSAIWLSSGDPPPSGIWERAALDYGLKGLLTWPIWYLLFQWLTHWSLRGRLLLHVLLMPAWLLGWQAIYYPLSDALGLGHLGWPRAWWDIYIPALFYLMQFGAFHAYDFYQQSRRRQEQEAALRQLALSSELRALKAQLNPHFLYNTFNTISASVPAELEQTRELVARLADMFRYQLNGSSQELLPLKEELNFVKKYLELEQARFGARLRYSFEVSPEAQKAWVPPLIIQPLVENAVRHGIAAQIEGGELWLSAQLGTEGLRVDIRNTGPRLSVMPEEEGYGLSYTRLRLEKRYQQPLHLEPWAHGAHFWFIIPQTDSQIFPSRETYLDRR